MAEMERITNFPIVAFHAIAFFSDNALRQKLFTKVSASCKLIACYQTQNLSGKLFYFLVLNSILPS